MDAVTKSNEWSGKRTFGGRCLHSTEQPHVLNPYEDVIETIGKTLRDFGACGVALVASVLSPQLSVLTSFHAPPQTKTT